MGPCTVALDPSGASCQQIKGSSRAESSKELCRNPSSEAETHRKDKLYLQAVFCYIGYIGTQRASLTALVLKISFDTKALPVEFLSWRSILVSQQDMEAILFFAHQGLHSRQQSSA